jgi:hypothetical protein
MKVWHPWQLKILGTIVELPAKQHCQVSPFGTIFEVNGLNWQCYLKVSKSLETLLPKNEQNFRQNSALESKKLYQKYKDILSC